MDSTIKAKLKWVKLYLEINDAGYVGRRCGIFSRSTHYVNGIDDIKKKV